MKIPPPPLTVGVSGLWYINGFCFIIRIGEASAPQVGTEDAAPFPYHILIAWRGWQVSSARLFRVEKACCTISFAGSFPGNEQHAFLPPVGKHATRLLLIACCLSPAASLLTTGYHYSLFSKRMYKLHFLFYPPD